ncbi:MAG: DNA helicase UvrD [Candidatus Bathyarchaeota archaeon]|nr:MAG: DNA helicase UvrD [Candidatus Bathyarchaeota archaeon]
MKVVADLHIHSRYSRATSKRMNIDEITRYARIKGLSLVGTGDFTHPKWFDELSTGLTLVSGASLYKSIKHPNSPVHFMITAEVATFFSSQNKAKKIHHVILTPSLETARQISERLSQYGDLKADGRPILHMNAALLVEEVMQVSTKNMVIPAHIWTPWFSLFGAFSGFDRIDDCYQDMTKNIHALETGLSSDPPMNWRLSALDRFTLISNSDSHSSWPWRIGREANAFDLGRLTYDEVSDSIRRKNTHRLQFTIETDPAYGKYHWSGHRNCRISLSPKKAAEIENHCPVCHKPLTKGVEQRVEELADRPPGFRPKGTAGYLRLLPLSEIISSIFGTSYPGTQRVWAAYNSLISRFSDEYTILLDAPLQEMSEIVDPRISEAITRVREGRVKVVPGYDGVYGQPILLEDEAYDAQIEEVSHKDIADFM